MAAKKKRKTTKSKPARKPRELEPAYMVQIHEPKMFRKHLLETLREIIIFMQGYEKFRKIQEEKVRTFTALKSDVKELSRLMDVRLRKFFPKGKLTPIREEVKPEPIPLPKPAPPVERPASPQPGTPPAAPQPGNDLDELENQLKDIEGQLKGI